MMLKTAATLFEYMKAHPDEVLQWCAGTRNNGWWWMRKGTHTIMVHGNAANALQRKNLLKRHETTWKTHNYKLSKTA